VSSFSTLYYFLKGYVCGILDAMLLMVKGVEYSLFEWHCGLVLVLPRMSAHRQTLFAGFECQFLSPFFIGLVTFRITIFRLIGDEIVLIILYMNFECIPLLKGYWCRSAAFTYKLSFRDLPLRGRIFYFPSVIFNYASSFDVIFFVITFWALWISILCAQFTLSSTDE
jgi:hypothetical protein